jgi:pyruvate formate lyase activating enzyme
MRVLAKFWEKMPEKMVKCSLCPHFCKIPDGKTGLCRARKNEGGKLYSLIYGVVTSMAVDPMEKKPLYHFWPGSDIFSIGTVGCNLFCRNCQNWTISQAKVDSVPYDELPPEKIVELAKEYNCSSIAFTYTEPSIWWEFCYDVAKLARKEGLLSVYVTNGYMNLPAWEEIRPFIDAANVDVKEFSDNFYQRICGAPTFKPVLETCEWLVKNGVHVETTYLVIPGENDKPEEIRQFCKWEVEKLGPDVPTHFSRFYPHYKMVDHPPTPVETLEMAVKIAKEEGLRYTYIGNVPGHEADNTYCYNCGELLIERWGFEVTSYKLKDNRCPKCGTKINIVGEHRTGKSAKLFSF